MQPKRFPYGKLIFFATGNINKFNEARGVLAEYGISVAMLKIKTVEIQDDDIENIAKARALNALHEVNLPLIVEDAGLFIDALKGFPGPFSSYVYKTIGLNGIIKLLNGVEDRRAHFKSAVVFCDPSGELKCFIGVSNGRIAREPRGSSGFGFDPIFEPDERPTKTFGEMGIEEKNLFSHRAKALRRFAEWYRDWSTS